MEKKSFTITRRAPLSQNAIPMPGTLRRPRNIMETTLSAALSTPVVSASPTG